MSTTFNPLELTTLDEAKALAARLTAYKIGGGVKPFTEDMRTSGIYIPEWMGGPSALEQGHGKDDKGKPTYWYEFRFQNGAEGVNAGLVKNEFDQFPHSPGYVVWELNNQIGSMRR